jgi:hypothetical protein
MFLLQGEQIQYIKCFLDAFSPLTKNPCSRSVATKQLTNIPKDRSSPTGIENTGGEKSMK